MTSFVLTPLPSPLPPLDPPPAGSLRVVADAPFGFPCRRCLRDAATGEALVLLSYDPFRGDSPYRQPGPVFVHERDCAPDPDAGAEALPEQLTRRLLSVRAFDADHRMCSASVVEGPDLAGAATEALAAEGVAYLHVHNAGPGCFAVRIDRAP